MRNLNTIVFDALDNARDNCPELFMEHDDNIVHDLRNFCAELNTAPFEDVKNALLAWLDENPHTIRN